MKLPLRLRAGVLATVVIVSTVLLLIALAVLSLWEADYLLFSRTHFIQTQRAHIRSTFTLYRHNPQIIDRLDADSTLPLYDSVPGSRMRLSRTPWGLYEVLSVSSMNGEVHQSCLFGAETPWKEDCNFYYCNHDGSVTATGKTNLKGKVRIPQNGIVYGQMRSVFFHGERITPQNISRSEATLPPVSARIGAIMDFMPVDMVELTDSIYQPFYRSDPLYVNAGTGMLVNCHISGQVALYGGELHFDRSCRLDDVLVIADNITIGEGFRGSAQLFARDTVWIEKNVTLEIPSGIYAGSYAEIADGTEVNGYAIVDSGGEKQPKKPNYRQSRLATLRGLLYVDGIAQLQGMVSGAVFLDEAAYYASEGYYRNMIFDATVLTNRETACPFWLETGVKRKEAKWVR